MKPCGDFWSLSFHADAAGGPPHLDPDYPLSTLAIDLKLFAGTRSRIGWCSVPLNTKRVVLGAIECHSRVLAQLSTSIYSVRHHTCRVEKAKKTDIKSFQLDRQPRCLNFITVLPRHLPKSSLDIIARSATTRAEALTPSGWPLTAACDLLTGPSLDHTVSYFNCHHLDLG